MDISKNTKLKEGINYVSSNKNETMEDLEMKEFNSQVKLNLKPAF
jgi:hypothetical protein